MAIVIPCPKCAARLSAPESAAGRTVRCPRPGCGGVAELPAYLPAEEVAVVDAVPAPVRPAPARDAVDDEDDRPRPGPRRDDEDERPRARRRRDDDFDRPRRRRRSGANPAAVAALVLGGMVLVAGVGVGVYVLVNKRGETAAGKDGGGNTGGNTGDNLFGINVGGGPGTDVARPRAPVPAGWVLHTSPGMFRAYFPKHPGVGTNTTSSLPGASATFVTSGGPREDRAAIVIVLSFPPRAAGVNQDHIAEVFRQGMLQKQMQGQVRIVSQRSLTWSGRKALEMTLESSNKKATVVYRQVVTDKCMYLAFYSCKSGPSPDEENGFFDNFEILE
jgi:hypothetical protein